MAEPGLCEAAFEIVCRQDFFCCIICDVPCFFPEGIASSAGEITPFLLSPNLEVNCSYEHLLRVLILIFFLIP
jgi:hypothetical protein